MNALKSQIQIFFSLLFSILTSTSHAQTEVWQFSLDVYGTELSCLAPNGTRVPLMLTERAIALGGGGYAEIKNGQMSILLSPTYMTKIGKMAATFTFFHECAHLALPIGVGLLNEEQESNADCYAISEMRKKGLISSWVDFSKSVEAVRQLPASSKGHHSGPVRIANAARCAGLPTLTSENTTCRAIDEIFSRGKGNLEIFSQKQPLRGFNCYTVAEGKSLQCERRISSETTRTEVAESAASELRQCMPAEFSSRRSTSRPEFAVFFTNESSGQFVSVHSISATDTVTILVDPK